MHLVWVLSFREEAKARVTSRRSSIDRAWSSRRILLRRASSSTPLISFLAPSSRVFLLLLLSTFVLMRSIPDSHPMLECSIDYWLVACEFSAFLFDGSKHRVEKLSRERVSIWVGELTQTSVTSALRYFAFDESWWIQLTCLDCLSSY